MNLNELYTQVITENSRIKENRHPVEGATHSLEGVNPSCGDDITLQLRVKDGNIEDAGFIGSHLAGFGFADDRPCQGPPCGGGPPPDRPVF